jgi:hypothetical protein
VQYEFHKLVTSFSRFVVQYWNWHEYLCVALTAQNTISYLTHNMRSTQTLYWSTASQVALNGRILLLYVKLCWLEAKCFYCINLHNWKCNNIFKWLHHLKYFPIFGFEKFSLKSKILLRCETSVPRKYIQGEATYEHERRCHISESATHVREVEKHWKFKVK